MTDTPESDLDRAVTDPAVLTTTLDTIANGLYAAIANLRSAPPSVPAAAVAATAAEQIEHHAVRIRHLAARAYEHATRDRTSGKDLADRAARIRTGNVRAAAAAATQRVLAARTTTLTSKLLNEIGWSVAGDLLEAGLLREPEGATVDAQWAAGRTRGAAADVAAAVLRQDAAIAVLRRDATRLDATLSDSLVEAIGASIATQLSDAGLLRQPPGGVTKTDLAAARQTVADHVVGVLHAETPNLSSSLIEAIAGRVADGLIGRGLCVMAEPPTEGEAGPGPWVGAAWDLVGHIDRMADQWAAMGPTENMSAEEHERAVAARNLELWDPLHHKARVLDEALTGRSLWLASAYDAAYRPSPEKSEPDMAERAANLREWEDENRADPADQPAATYLRVPFADADGEEGVHVHRADTASARLAVLREVCDMRAAAPLEEVLAVALWVTNGVLP